MMRLAIAAIMLACATCAGAQQPAAPEAPSPLTYYQLQLVAEGLAKLDGYDKLAKDGSREFTVKIYFEFKKGLRGLIADDITKARPALRELSDRNNELVRQYSEGTDKVLDKNMAEFTAAQRKLVDASSGVTLAHIKWEELELDKNSQITGTVLSLLDPILDRP